MIHEFNMVRARSIPRLLNHLDVAKVLSIQVFELDTTWIQSETFVVIPLELVLLLIIWHQCSLALVQVHDILKLFLVQALAFLERPEPILL